MFLFDRFCLALSPDNAASVHAFLNFIQNPQNKTYIQIYVLFPDNIGGLCSIGALAGLLAKHPSWRFVPLRSMLNSADTLLLYYELGETGSLTMST